jgi:hypothetical protein
MAVQQAILSVVGVGVGACVAAAVVSASSPQAAFSMINALQLVLLLPLIGTYLPDQVVQFIIGLDIVMLNPSIISLNNISKKNNWISQLSKTQENEFLYEIGVKTSSTAVNQTGTF